MNRNKILIIEDDSKIRKVLVSLLSEKGYEVYETSKGREGIKKAKDIIPTVVICDIMLPDVDGYQVCEKLRENTITKNTIIIFLTAKTEMKDLRKGMNIGADDYLIKPFNSKELLDVIETRIQKQKSILDETNSSDGVLSEENNIFIQNKENVQILKISSIAAIAVDGVFTSIYSNKGEKFILRKSISHWEKVLPQNVFFRTHRSYIVNQKFIEKIEPWYKQSFLIKIKNIDEEFFISERYAKKLKKKFSF